MLTHGTLLPIWLAPSRAWGSPGPKPDIIISETDEEAIELALAFLTYWDLGEEDALQE